MSSPNRSPPSALRLLAPSPFADASLAENAKPGRNASRRQLVQRPRLFWERNSTRRQLSQIGGGCAAGLGSVSLVNQASYSPCNDSCQVTLVKQASNAKCIQGRSYGCEIAHDGQPMIWVHNCRGKFRCAGRKKNVDCGTWDKPEGSTCACDEQLDVTRARFADFYPWLEEEVEQENASRFCFGNMDWQGNCNALPNAPGAPRDDQPSAFPC